MAEAEWLLAADSRGLLAGAWGLEFGRRLTAYRIG